MFNATFNLVARVKYRIFGTLKVGSLQINSLALNNNFSFRNVFQNGVNSFPKMILKSPIICNIM